MYDYYIMKVVNLISKNDQTVRTQVTLTKDLKRLVEKQAQERGESLSEYLRKAAMVRLLLDEKNMESRESLANRVIGSVSLKNHPKWKNKKKVQKWLREIRQEHE